MILTLFIVFDSKACWQEHWFEGKLYKLSLLFRTCIEWNWIVSKLTWNINFKNKSELLHHTYWNGSNAKSFVRPLIKKIVYIYAWAVTEELVWSMDRWPIRSLHEKWNVHYRHCTLYIGSFKINGTSYSLLISTCFGRKNMFFFQLLIAKSGRYCKIFGR